VVANGWKMGYNPHLPMTILEILKFPDARLRKKCLPVREVTSELKQLAADMLETMYASKGIGLAAAQVNQQIRLIVVDTRPRENGRYKLEDQTEMERAIAQPLVLFNPVIMKKVGKTTYDEGCLSVPTYYETVSRADLIEVKALDVDGKPLQFTTDGLLAICIQHEIDHLDGKLFIDRLSPIKSARIKNKIKKYGYPDPSHPRNEEEVEELEAEQSEEREEHRL
jgi:peptide deformylase